MSGAVSPVASAVPTRSYGNGGHDSQQDPICDMADAVIAARWELAGHRRESTVGSSARDGCGSGSRKLRYHDGRPRRALPCRVANRCRDVRELHLGGLRAAARVVAARRRSVA